MTQNEPTVQFRGIVTRLAVALMVVTAVTMLFAGTGAAMPTQTDNTQAIQQENFGHMNGVLSSGSVVCIDVGWVVYVKVCFNSSDTIWDNPQDHPAVNDASDPNGGGSTK